MEKRKPEKVQFFQLGAGKDIQPIWVFRQTNPGAVLGLLLEIGTNGAKVLTERSHDLSGGAYQLIVYAVDQPGGELLKANVQCLWSKHDGTLYIHNDLVFKHEVTVQEVLDLLHLGSGWLRCELLPLTNHPELQRHAV